MAISFLSCKRTPHILLCHVVLLVILWPGLSTARGLSKDVARARSEACGPAALRSALSLLGRDVNPAACADLAETDANGVTTMAGLLRAVRSLQIPARAMRVTPHELALIDAPAILHASLPGDRDHFVVFRGPEGARLEISDPSNKIQSALLTPAQLGLMWDGHCIVFTPKPLRTYLRVAVHRARAVLASVLGLALGVIGSSYVLARMSKGVRTEIQSAVRERIALFRMVGLGTVAGVVLLLLCVWIVPQDGRAGSPVFLGADVLDVGEIDWMTSFATSVWTCNEGRRPIQVYNNKIKSSSASVRAKASQVELPAGTKGELKIALRPQRRVGPFEHSLLVPFSDDAGVATLKVRGSVLGPGTVYPPRLYFGRVESTQLLRRKLLYFAHRPEARVQEIRCGSHSIETHVVSRSAFLTEIEVILPVPREEGDLRGTLEILADDRPEGGIVVPFEGTVVPDRAGSGL